MFVFFSSRRRHTRYIGDWSSDVCSSDLVESEKLALDYYREHKVPVVVLRPGFIYGPRDRTVLLKLIENLRNGIVRYLGKIGRASCRERVEKYEGDVAPKDKIADASR